MTDESRAGPEVLMYDGSSLALFQDPNWKIPWQDDALVTFQVNITKLGNEMLTPI